VDALNSVKLDLALAVTLCVAGALLVAALPLETWAEFLVLSVLAVGAAGWVVLRTRRAVRRLRAETAKGERVGARQE
jgi:hypothetical protein